MIRQCGVHVVICLCRLTIKVAKFSEKSQIRTPKLNDKIKDLVEKNEKRKDEAKQSKKAHDAEERVGFAQHRLQNSMRIWKLMLLIAHTVKDPGSNQLVRKVIEIHQAIDVNASVVDQKSEMRISMLWCVISQSIVASKLSCHWLVALLFVLLLVVMWKMEDGHKNCALLYTLI